MEPRLKVTTCLVARAVLLRFSEMEETYRPIPNSIRSTS